jgi:hypothetical protein
MNSRIGTTPGVHTWHWMAFVPMMSITIKPEKPTRDCKTVPGNIERHLFPETKVTGYRLKDVA